MGCDSGIDARKGTMLDEGKRVNRTKEKRGEKEMEGERKKKRRKKKKEEKEGERGGGRKRATRGCDRLHNCTVHSTNVSILSINPRYKSNLRFGRRGGKIPWGADGQTKPRI